MSSIHNLVDVAIQVDFVYSNATNRNNQFADLGYDSLHSTPKQRQLQEKELQSFEVEEMTEMKKVNNKLSSKILEKLPNSCCRENQEQIIENKVDENEPERLVWDKKMDFLLSIIGFAVDLANVWRFPYLCYKNGGGVFLIPYSLMLIFTALPLFFLELSLGQFNKSGPITLWNKVCPSMKGVGYCCVLIAWYVSFYYNVIIGWTFYYIYITLTSGSSLPWAHCGNPWNTDDCLAISSVMDIENKTCLNSTDSKNRTSSAVEFYKRGVLQIHESRGLEDMGSIRWPIVICVACVFVVLYFSLFKGVKSSGKVVWVTATAPYIILTILLIRGLFLPGAVDGIKYYLEPRLDELKKASVWIDAANQVFFSVGVGFGVHLTYADALLTVAVNSLTSFYSGFVIFTYLGYMANGMCKKIGEVAQEGYGLVFMVYPEAISTLPYSHVWALLFFVMLVTLGLDSAMGGLEAVITGLMDEFRFKSLKREQFTAIVLFASFLMSLINTSQGGGYTMYWFDVYAASVSLLCSALYEAIAISYCYGLDRFCADIKLMINYYPSNYWRICWKFMSPLCLSSIVLLTLYDAASNPLTWETYRFPLWSIILGWLFSLLPVAVVPIVYIIRLILTRSHIPAFDCNGIVDDSNQLHAQPLSAANCSQSLKCGLRSSKSFSFVQRPNITLIRRKSAVERLQETKSQYVKSETVRDSKQFLESLTANCRKIVNCQSSTPQHENNANLNFRRRTVSASRLSEDKSKINVELQLRQLFTNSENLEDLNKSQKLPVSATSSMSASESSNSSSCLASKRTLIDSVENTNNLRAVSCITVRKNENSHKSTPVMSRKSLEIIPRKVITIRNNSSHNYDERYKVDIGANTQITPVKCHNFQTTISRSKSDIGHRVVKPYRPKSKDEIERFFDTIGLDSTTWASITSSTSQNSLTSTPPHFFESTASLDSDARLSHSSASSQNGWKDNSRKMSHFFASNLHLDPFISRDTSIVEKNARVIKWLCNCRKAMMESS